MFAHWGKEKEEGGRRRKKGFEKEKEEGGRKKGFEKERRLCNKLKDLFLQRKC